MLEREELIEELWRRLASVEGVAYTARNPKAEPNESNMPCVQFFELDDDPKPAQSRGGAVAYPVYKRELKVIVEAFVKGTTEASSSKELGLFVQEVKKALYTNGNVLIPNCFFIEVEGSRILRPPTGGNIIGIGLVLQVSYIEDTSRLFA